MIEVVNAVRAPIATDLVRLAVERASEVPEVAARLPEPGWELTVRISGDRELRRLNRQFLDEDHPTDVLSFPSGDPGGSYLGDLVLSWPAVRRQAQEFGHSEPTELSLLVVHGFLHLLGWDHATAEETIEMSRLTYAGLARLGMELAQGRL